MSRGDHGIPEAWHNASAVAITSAAEEDSPKLFCFAQEDGKEVWSFDNRVGFWSTPAVVGERLEQATLYLQELAGEEPAYAQRLWNVPSRSARRYEGRIPDLIEDLRKGAIQGQRTVCVMRAPGSAKRLREILGEYDLQAGSVDGAAAVSADPWMAGGLFVGVAGLRAGFEMPELGLTVLAERDLFAEERKAAEERMAFLTQYDSLTQLPNRALLRDRLTQAMHRAQRMERLVGVLLLDLDRFMSINDSLGHRVGDELLRHVARNFQAIMRDGDVLAQAAGKQRNTHFLGTIPAHNDRGLHTRPLDRARHRWPEGASQAAFEQRVRGQHRECRHDQDEQQAPVKAHQPRCPFSTVNQQHAQAPRLRLRAAAEMRRRPRSTRWLALLSSPGPR